MITLGIMPVRIVLHVHPMPVIQEFELIEINSFIHGRISLHFIHSSTKKGCAGGIINRSYPPVSAEPNRSFSDLTAGAVA